jgi:protein TonB
MNAAGLSVPTFQSALPLRQRVIIMACVVVAHGAVLAQPWLAAPGLTSSTARELTVSIANMPASRPAMKMPRNSVAVNKQAQPEPQLAAAEQTHTEPAQAAAPGLPDREPEYRASYLNNPQPGYPLAARRMGWQGRVVIEVEVLADGSPGEVAVQQSSGREVLDEAALRAVRGWRFVPARVGGIAVTKRFQIPIAFNLT